MKKFKKTFLMIIAIAVMTGSLAQPLLAFEKWKKDEPTTDLWNALDLAVARPLGVAAAVLGLGIFTATLPFTITVDVFSGRDGKPPSAVRDSATMFMLRPLQFSFTREFPDENM